jgi:hypothetical protein
MLVRSIVHGLKGEKLPELWSKHKHTVGNLGNALARTGIDKLTCCANPNPLFSNKAPGGGKGGARKLRLQYKPYANLPSHPTTTWRFVLSHGNHPVILIWLLPSSWSFQKKIRNLLFVKMRWWCAHSSIMATDSPLSSRTEFFQQVGW